MDEIIREVAKTLNIPQDHVEKVIYSFFRTFKRTVTKTKYRDLDSLEGVKTNAVIPGFGKLVVTNKKYRKITKDKPYGK